MDPLLMQLSLLDWFGSPAMLWWGLAAAVPVLIHLWSRRRYDEVPWAAMRFLLAAVRKNARRWRIEQLILLAVRVLVLLLLALALADPQLQLWDGRATGEGRGGETHVVLVIDASYSMDYRPSSATRFELAKGLASQYVRESLQGDGFALIQLADRPDVVVRDPVFDRESMVTEIAQLSRTDGGADLAGTLAEVEQVLEETAARHPRLQRHVVCFFTDLGRNTWGDMTGESIQATLRRLAERAELTLFDVGQSDGQNVAVTRLVAADGVATVGAPVRLDLELENFGSQDRTDQTVHVLVDSQTVAELRSDVEAGGRTSLSTVHRFPAPGEHVVEVRLEEDRLEADNRRWLSLKVRPAMEVLCVEGKSGAARHVAWALEPSSEAQTHVRPVIRSEIALLEEDLNSYDCIFLCNVGRFGAGEARLLHRFLQRGGGVIVFLGDQVQSDNYNTILGPDAGVDSCFSLRLDAPSELGEYLLDPLDYQHPIVAPFRGHERSGLLTTPIWKYVKSSLEPGSSAIPALALQNGDPAMVVESMGNGTIVIVTTDASSVSWDRSTDPPTPWSALAAWPSFPPLVHQMLKVSVRGRATLRNVLVGQALRGWLPPGSADTSVLVTDPAAHRQRVPVKVEGNSIPWTYTETALGGIYLVAPATSPDGTQRFAVNVNTDESRLDRFDVRPLPGPIVRETVVDTRGETGDVTVTRKPVPYLFRYVLFAVLGLLLCETTLAWFFGRATA